MANAYYIGEHIKKHAPHHESFKALWDTKWQKPCSMGVYPFMFGTTKDFEPIVNELNGMQEPYEWDAYAETFFPTAQELVRRASEAEKAGEKEKAGELYMRASAVYRISRFPISRSPKQKLAWTMGKEACLKGLQLQEHPVHEVLVPHYHAIEGEGDTIPIYHQVPEGASSENPAPCVVIFTGLDGYRTELVVWAEGWRQVGVALIVVEIPGTGDSPALATDPTSPDRQWSSLLDWIDTQAAVDSKKLIVWGFSTGGYYAIRLAHTHKDRIMAATALGGGCHHMFDEAWLDEVNHLEYPFDLAHALAYKFGYGSDLEAFKKEGKKFSLLEDGTLDKPCARLFLVNGTDDEIFPIEDMYRALEHGSPKEARFVKDVKHMGEPSSFTIILNWIYEMLDIKSHPGQQLQTIPSKAKY
ncbi:hypothetical protein EPUS_03003 [Endocarpon pusillum Z07020]|uniref:Uncharacterized protein n=1 Tax=Endocarpon pusillum (strain Z07020 / HMAS-L-300199) TaxID=1263415 RepID=U1G6Z8_ENDPU|nr:uncharacterized protein EPUS_03003 [Endocarpon pusillum Z07020]ERF73162.1 hypothetical protein EPUS_03003 [Endocarpon pusillum Z07020]